MRSPAHAVGRGRKKPAATAHCLTVSSTGQLQHARITSPKPPGDAERASRRTGAIDIHRHHFQSILCRGTIKHYVSRTNYNPARRHGPVHATPTTASLHNYVQYSRHKSRRTGACWSLHTLPTPHSELAALPPSLPTAVAATETAPRPAMPMFYSKNRLRLAQYSASRTEH